MINIYSILGPLAFFILPLLIGRGAYLLSKRKTASQPGVSYFITGSLIIYSIALVLRYPVMSVFKNTAFSPLFFTLIYAAGIISLILNILSLRKLNLKGYKKYITPVIVSLVLSLIAYKLWITGSMYPLNWDLYEHQTLSNLIQKGTFSYVTSEISDTFVFNGYSSIFHVLLAVSQFNFVKTPKEILNFWIYISFIHLFLTVLASYLFAWVISENETVSLLSAVFGAFIFESTVAYTSLVFIPQTFAAVIFIFLMTRMVIELKKGKTVSPGQLLADILFLILVHYIVGIVAALIYLGVQIYLRFIRPLTKGKTESLFLILAVFAFYLVLAIISKINLGYLNNGEAAFYTFSLTQKISYMQNSYGYSLLIFLPLGFLAAVRSRELSPKMVLVITMLLLIFVIANLPYVLKFYVLARFFVHLLMALGIYYLLKRIKNGFLESIGLIMIISMTLVIYLTNISYWKNILAYRNQFNHVSDYDVAAGEFLKARFGNTDALIVSDPATQYILEGLTGVNSQGGAYADENTRKMLDSLNPAGNTLPVQQALYGITDRLTNKSGPRLFVISGRYFLWQKAAQRDKYAFPFNIWAPYDLTINDYRYIQTLNNLPNVGQIYANPGMVIYEVKNKLG